jgi:SAM-dependent methyltransferase
MKDAIIIDDDIINKTVQNIMHEVLIDQAWYAEKFVETANFLDKNQFYETVVKFMDLKNERCILDIGCGDCRLIREIYNIRPNTTIVGVDINPLLLMKGEKILTELKHKVNIHCGVNIAMHPITNVLTLISDLMHNKEAKYNFKRSIINLIQEDIRFAEVLKRDINTIGGIDVITYTLAGGFSPHIQLEKEKDDANIVKAGIELNKNVMSFGVNTLKSGGRIILVFLNLNHIIILRKLRLLI